jgi:hypothetical protein
MVELKPGARLRSQVCPTEVVVVKAPTGELALACGGHPMILASETPAAGLAPADGEQAGTQLGKRYTDEAATLELLVTKPGSGTLGLGGEPLVLKQAKPLPASD